MNKRIFQYFNGVKNVWADPVSIERKWYKISGNVDIDRIMDQFYGPPFMHNFINNVACDSEGIPIPDITEDMINFAIKQRESATEELLPVLYEVFQLSPIDPETGEGTTEKEIVDAFNDWQTFIFEVKKNTEKTPNSPQSTMEEISELPTLPTIQTMQPGNEFADSDGTKNES